jgi:putative membrane protein
MSGHDSLLAHMVRHVILGAALPPLVWLLAPLILRVEWFPPRTRVALAPFGRALTHPATTWLAGTLTVIGWHIPAAFELAQRSEIWQAGQDASFLLSGLLFWWPVVRPWPVAARLSEAMIPVYLFAATLPCDVLSAFLVFSDRVLYRPALVHAGNAAASALAVQQEAGAFMWVVITFLYLIPALLMTVHAVVADREVA